MSMPSIAFNCNSGNATIKEEQDLEGSMSLQPPPPPPLPSSSTSSQPQQSLSNVCVKREPEELANGQVPMSLLMLPQVPSDYQEQRNGIEADDPGAKLGKSLNELGNLSVAIHAFKSRFDELHKHLDFIDKAIDTRSKELVLAPNTMQNAATVSPAPSLGNNVNGTAPLNPQSATEKEDDLDSNPKLKPKTESEENELLSLCRMMCSRGLRRYIVSHLSDPVRLREQVPAALKSAPKSFKLVFECFGRFFLQGSKAYNKDSPMIPARQASVLVLEYYLMSGCVESERDVDPSLKEEANLAAIAWRKRLIVEGGVSKACEIDARGLLLFIACFGIPANFRNDDIRDLVRLSNPSEILHALRQSRGLLSRVSDSMEGLLKKGIVVEAVDLAYTFGFEKKITPQTTLTSFLQNSEDAWKKSKQETRGSATALKEANEKYLASLKSIVKCLEGHKIDPIIFLPGWQLKEKIINLGKDITNANRKIEEKIMSKRKVDRNDSSNKLKFPESKRSRFTVKDPSLVLPSVAVLQEQRIASHPDGNSSYDRSLAVHFLDGRLASHSNNYPTASSVQLGSVVGFLPESFLGVTVASGAGIRGAIPGAGMLAGIGSAATDSFSGYHGDTVIDNVGTMLNSNGQLYSWHRNGERALSNERSVGQSTVGQPASARVNSLYGLSPSLEGFAGLPGHPSIGVANRTGGSDLYSFADGVFEGGSLQDSSSRKAANLPPIVPAHRSSYMH